MPLPLPPFPSLLRRLLMLLALGHALGIGALQAQAQLGPLASIVEETAGPDRFPLHNGSAVAPLWHDPLDHAGVLRAIGDLRTDVQKVTSALPSVATSPWNDPPSAQPVIIGTLGRSLLIDRLVAEGKLDAAPLSGKWESFVITTVNNPFPGVQRALVIAGSDKRGTIYGIYELAEQLGVSPWHWWADVPVRTRTAAHIIPGPHASGEPAVRYRGMFLNNEAPALTRWTQAKFGGRNRNFYTKVFELLLRLRGNYLWPAMWGDAFSMDDAENPRLADEYGIVMGTSHHEPMMRAQQEWSRTKASYGNAQWNYTTNAEGLRSFWRGGFVRNNNYENLVTIGMRGDGDLPMIDGGDPAANSALLATIIADQRTIISQETGAPASQTPQVWALYKEVQDYYDRGLRPPDDVTILYCNDNWGNIRRVPPTQAERDRPGGSGMYFHFDYVGGPRSYKWLNTVPLPKIQEQMNLAWNHGVNRLWIVNVGDLKPMEVPIEFFLRMAWNPAAWPAERCEEFLHLWATREFGATHAAEAAELVARYVKFNARRKPELLESATFSLLNHREADRVLAEWRDLSARALALHAALPPSARDTAYQLIVHPVQASANLNELYITAARASLHANQSRASTNATADRARDLFQIDANLTSYWNTQFAAGRWTNLMDQVHIGYTSWNEPAANTLPALASYAPPVTSEFGVAPEGSAGGISAGGVGILPILHSEGGPATRHLDLFRRGTLPTAFTITASQPWVTITPSTGTLGADVRSEVGIDWTRAPIGSGEVLLTIRGSEASTARTVRLPFTKAPPAPASQPMGFLDPEGYIAIEAPNFDRAVSSGSIGWKVLPDHGRNLGAVTPFPVTATSIENPGGATPRLEYDVYLRRQGELSVRLIVSPTLNYLPPRGVRCAISLNEQTPQIIDISTEPESTAWGTAVRDSVRTVNAALSTDRVGHHVLKVWMVDPGVVLQRIEIDTGGLKSTYLGSPESPRGRRPAPTITSVTTPTLVTFEAESGTLGAEMQAVTSSVPGYITVTTDGAGSTPATAARVARYQVTFPSAGGYRLYARLRVGPAAANDDSFFIGNGFGAKSPNVASNWRTLNNFSGAGFADLSSTVTATGGTTGTGVWKWIDAGALGGLPVFTVPAGALTQTFDVGGRENGLHIDRFVFAPDGRTYTVENLMQSNGGTEPVPNAHVLEAETSVYGSGFTLNSGTPTFLNVATSGGGTPGSSARVMRFNVTFSMAATYRLFARVRVGSGASNDDSFLLATSFGAKDPTLAADWRTINNFSGNGFANAGDVVSGTGGTAGVGVWKWLDVSAYSGTLFTVGETGLTQILDLGGREDGLDIDKIVFAPERNTLTVADLDAGSRGTPRSVAPVFTVVASDQRQAIDGFGASSAWTANALTDTQADQFFSTTTGIGLSLLRVRITPEGTTDELVTAQKALARGASVWATPWSPPAAWKSNNDVNNGGTLLPEQRGAWASRLADFALSMQNAGVPLVALSAQNEPNFTATWASCIFSASELASFVRDHLGPALASRGVQTRVLAPETINTDALASYGSTLLGDPTTRSFVSHLATHSYGRVPVPFPEAAAAGLPYWQTEFTDDALASDPGIDSGLRTAEAIHNFLAVAEGNAWHYWWLNSFETGSSGLVEGGGLAKRGWAMGNWSRFVRPGHRRVEAYGSVDGVKVSAFRSPTGRQLTIVAVNSEYSAVTVPLAIEGGTVPSLTPWETSAGRSLGQMTQLLPASDGSFSLSLPARSITTFASDGFNQPPSQLSLTGSSVAENLPAGTIVGNLTTLDADPGETFSYAFATGPGDTHNSLFTLSGNELRTAALLDHESAPIRSLRVRVTDAAGAGLEREFLVHVTNDPGEYEDWAAALPIELREPEADPTGSGVPNLVAHALGAAPGMPVQVSRMPTTYFATSGVRFGFAMPAPAHPRLGYTIERSTALSSWTTIATKWGAATWSEEGLVEVLPLADGTEWISVEAAPSALPVFHRLRIQLAPVGE